MNFSEVLIRSQKVFQKNIRTSQKAFYEIRNKLDYGQAILIGEESSLE